MRLISALASYNVKATEKLFGDRVNARATAKEILKSRKSTNQRAFEVNGVYLKTQRTKAK